MSQDQSPADLLSAADPALTITEEELERSRQRSLSFVNSNVTHIAVGGSIHEYHRAPAKRHWGRFAAAGLAAAAVAACVLVASSLVSKPDNMAAAPTGQPVSTATATATATASPAPDPSATSAGAEATPSGGAGPITGPASAVNPEDYRAESGSGYFFTSPSGNLLCGFLTDYPKPPPNVVYTVGCEAGSVVANMPRCDDPRGNAAFISLSIEGAVETKCWNQGLYAYPTLKTPNPNMNVPQDAHGGTPAALYTRILQYGQEITVGTLSCQSHETGITCREAQSGHAFLASREEFAQIP